VELNEYNIRIEIENGEIDQKYRKYKRRKIWGGKTIPDDKWHKLEKVEAFLTFWWSK